MRWRKSEFKCPDFPAPVELRVVLELDVDNDIQLIVLVLQPANSLLWFML